MRQRLGRTVINSNHIDHTIANCQTNNKLRVACIQILVNKPSDKCPSFQGPLAVELDRVKAKEYTLTILPVSATPRLKAVKSPNEPDRQDYKKIFAARLERLKKLG
jgi:ATP-dependent protease HslVU (ClpYQ) ATPase subunit